LFTNYDLKSLTESQYYLSKHSNISLTESSLLAVFEFDIFVNMLLKDIEREIEKTSYT